MLVQSNSDKEYDINNSDQLINSNENFYYKNNFIKINKKHQCNFINNSSRLTFSSKQYDNTLNKKILNYNQSKNQYDDYLINEHSLIKIKINTKDKAINNYKNYIESLKNNTIYDSIEEQHIKLKKHKIT
jgi:hypothetical protein